MDLNLTHEMISINESIFDGRVEQAVELDYTLPDYYPSIFKLLKCRICPKIFSCRTSGDKLVIDGVVMLKVLYLCEEKHQMHCLEQKLPFTKTVDMKSDCKDPIITYCAKGDYINCRVINPRRIDMRGAASIEVKVCAQKEEQVIVNAEGMGMQLNKSEIGMGSEHLWATKQFSIEEQVDVGYGKPGIGEILSCEAIGVLSDCKLIANKIVAKGDVLLHILYCPNEENAPPQTSEHSLPISQIIDLPGVDETYDCTTTFDITGIQIDLDHQSEGGIGMGLDITACCDAYRNKEMQGVSDAFSTQYDATMTSKEIKTEQLLLSLADNLMCKQMMDAEDMQQVYDIWSSISNLTAKPQNDAIHFMADLNAMVIGTDKENLPCMIEKTIPIEFNLAGKIKLECAVVSAHAQVTSVEHNLSGNNLELRMQIQVNGKVCCETKTKVLTDIMVDESQPKTTNPCALTIYYADPDEQVWEIAKRYNTSVAAIMDENNLETDRIAGRCMILIPIV